MNDERQAEIRSAILKAADEQFKRRQRQVHFMQLIGALLFGLGLGQCL